MIFPDTALKLLMEASVGHHDRLLACGIIEGRIESLEEALEGKSNELVAAYDGWRAEEARVAELEAALADGGPTTAADWWEAPAVLAAEKGDDHE